MLFVNYAVIANGFLKRGEA